LRGIAFHAPVPDVPELPDLLDRDALAALGVALPDGEPRGDPDAVLHLYDHEPRVRRLFPLGLTPAQLPALLVWLLRVRQRVGLREDDVLAFYAPQARDPARGLAATYRRQPGW